MWRKFLFTSYSDSKSSFLLLISRLVFGLLLMTHGWVKYTHFSEMSASFPDPFGIGSAPSLMLVIFAELFCSIAFIFGFLFRLSSIPLIINMGVAFFSTHGARLAEGELAFIYLVIFILIYVAGPGKYSIDYFFYKRFIK